MNLEQITHPNMDSWNYCGEKVHVLNPTNTPLQQIFKKGKKITDPEYLAYLKEITKHSYYDEWFVLPD